MTSLNNNQFEVKVNSKSKRKITAPSTTAYLNPALDILANDDPMCNTAMEIVPIKKRKRSRSCEIVFFENTGLDIGVKKPVNEFLVKEIENVRNTVKSHSNSVEHIECAVKASTSIENKENSLPEINSDPIYANLTDLQLPTSIISNKPKNPHCIDLSGFQPDISAIEMDSGISVMDSKQIHRDLIHDSVNSELQSSTITNTNITNQLIINNTSNINLSFIDRLALDSPSLTNQNLCLDDDLNESNIMEIKTITIITKKKRVIDKNNRNPFLSNDNVTSDDVPVSAPNPFLDITKPEIEYNEEIANRPVEVPIQGSNLMPRRLFSSDTNSTISTVNESINTDQHEYENIDSYRSESPVYENINGEVDEISTNKQSKILGHDVSRFSIVDILNLNKHSDSNSSQDVDGKKDLKHQIKKASNKLSKKVLKTLKKTFKHEKDERNVTLNPYEVPRKPNKQKVITPKDAGIENPALKLDNSDDIEFEEIDDEEHQYETVKTIRNTQYNMNLTPLRERVVDNINLSQNKSNTPGKKVRFDSTLNQEKLITGNSFELEVQSPGFDAKIDKYHDELENCINERKFIQQNM